MLVSNFAVIQKTLNKNVSAIIAMEKTRKLEQLFELLVIVFGTLSLLRCCSRTNAQSEGNICNSFSAAQQCQQFPQSCLWSGNACFAIPCEVFTIQTLCENKQDGLSCTWRGDRNACVFMPTPTLVSAVNAITSSRPTAPLQISTSSANAIASTLFSSCWLYTTQANCVVVSDARINDDDCIWTNNRCFPASLFLASSAPAAVPAVQAIASSTTTQAPTVFALQQALNPSVAPQLNFVPASTTQAPTVFFLPQALNPGNTPQLNSGPASTTQAPIMLALLQALNSNIASQQNFVLAPTTQAPTVIVQPQALTPGIAPQLNSVAATAFLRPQEQQAQLTPAGAQLLQRLLLPSQNALEQSIFSEPSTRAPPASSTNVPGTNKVIADVDVAGDLTGLGFGQNSPDGAGISLSL